MPNNEVVRLYMFEKNIIIVKANGAKCKKMKKYNIFLRQYVLWPTNYPRKFPNSPPTIFHLNLSTDILFFMYLLIVG